MMNQIERLYNPEYDVIRGGPLVTWAEYDLYEAIVDLTKRVEKLEAERDQLKQDAKDAFTLASGESLE